MILDTQEYRKKVGDKYYLRHTVNKDGADD